MSIYYPFNQPALRRPLDSAQPSRIGKRGVPSAHTRTIRDPRCRDPRPGSPRSRVQPSERRSLYGMPQMPWEMAPEPNQQEFAAPAGLSAAEPLAMLQLSSSVHAQRTTDP
jgi:hypothetical protein